MGSVNYIWPPTEARRLPQFLESVTPVKFGLLTVSWGQILVVISIRAGEVSAIVPFRYAAILWSLAYSALIWREFPDKLTLLGIAIVCSAGLHLLS